MRLVIVLLALAACGPAAPPRVATPRLPVVADQAKPEPPPDLTLPVSAIRVTGLPKQRAAAAWALIATRAGAPADPRQLQRDAQAIWGLGGIADIQIRARQEAGAVSITFEVEERPLIGKVDFEGVVLGTGSIGADAHFGVVGGERFEPARLLAGRAALTQAYVDEGFRFAEVAWSVAGGADGMVDVTVAVTEGPQVGIRSISFRGYHRFSAAELAAILKQNAGAASGEPYRAERVSLGLLHLLAAYYDHGHVNARIADVEETFSADRTEVELVIPIEEGAQFKVGKLSVEGDLIATSKRYLELIGVKRGAVFSRSELAAGMARVVAHHRLQGKGAPRVDPLTTVDADRHVVDVRFVVTAP